MSELRNFPHSGRTSVELFAGAGGLAMGVEQAGFRSLLLSELAPRACETLVANGAIRHEADGESPKIPDPGDAPPLAAGDIAKVRFKRLAGRVDLIAGGPPCQPFSLGGVGRGDEDQRNGFPQMFRAIREIRPKAVICENVPGLLRPSFVPYFNYIKRELSLPFEKRRKGATWHEHDERLQELMRNGTGALDEQYEVKHFSVNAADYGVPQIRNRVLIVAIRRDLTVDMNQLTRLAAPRFSETSLIDSMLDGRYWDRHSDVPRHVRARVMERVSRHATPLPAPDLKAPWRTFRDALKGQPDQKPLPPIPIEYLDRRDHNLGGFSDHIGWPDARIYKGHTPNELDRPAKTVKAGVHGVAGGETVVKLDDGSHRYMSVRETARVMSFPDDWKLKGPRSEQMRQLGNAVPVLLGHAFATAVAQVLDEAERDPGSS